MRVLFQILRADTILVIPRHPFVDPTLVPLFIGSRNDEILDFQLFKLANTENEILRCNFIAVCLADLSYTKRKLAICRIQNVFEIDENALRGFRSEVGDVLIVFDRSDCRLEHQIKRARFGQVVESAFRTLFAGLDLVRSKALFTLAAVDQRVGKSRLMTGISQNESVHEDGSVQPFHIVALVNVCPPPRALDIVFELDAHWAVIPGALEAAVKLASLKQKAPPLAQRYDLVHRCTGH